MKNLRRGNPAQVVRWAMLTICCGMLVASAAYAQGGIHVAPGTSVKSREPLTNERIVHMVKQGEPDAAIIAAIQANPVEFDLSRQQKLALRQEGVSRQVLNAMVTAEQRRSKGLGESAGPNARELSPQPYPPKNGTLLTPGAQHTMLGTRANSAPGDGSKSALLPGVQQPAITGGAMGDGSVRPAVSTPTAAPGPIGPGQSTSAQENASSTAGPGSVPSKGSGRKKYEPITLQKGVTQDKTFSTWSNSAQAPGKGSPSTRETESATNVGGQAKNTGSGGALPSLHPRFLQDSANTGPGSGTGAQQLRKLNPPARMAMRPLTAKMRAKLGPPKKVQPIQNLRALQTSAAITLVLQRQRQAAEAEASRLMKLGIRPQGQAGTLGQQSQVTSATGSRTAAPVVQPQANATLTGGNKPSTATQSTASRTLLAPTAVQMAPRTVSGNPGPIHTESATVNPAGASPRPGATPAINGAGVNAISSNGNRLSVITHVVYGPVESMALICAQDPTMRILSVNGSSSFDSTFTPVGLGNFYTITGCSFGNNGPNAKVYIYKGSTFHEEFQIQEWHDNWIKLNLDPNLTGVLDQNNLTLVVQRADGQQTSKSGFKFYAARSTRLLNRIPSNYFSLWGFTTADTSKWSQNYTSPIPAGDDWGYGFGGMTAEVAISEGLIYIFSNDFETPQNTPFPGRDVYDLSHLQPGFAPTEADISGRDMSCQGGTLVTSGSFDGEFNGGQLWINFPGENCSHMSHGPSTDIFAIPPFVYGLNVYVNGPWCVDPWSGQPVDIGPDGKCTEQLSGN